jgi:hypothetical protein
MFHKSLTEICFADVQSFCSTFTEGVRVEYKSEMIDKIPKVVSAFANTMGGIVVIGVKADKVTNKVNVIDGIDPIDGLEEKILNSCFTGIYPSVFPEVKVLQIPEKNKILVIIKIHESEEAPHAVENTTRVYIRTGSLSNPYELSEIDRLEYLLKKRGQKVLFRKELIQLATERLNNRFLSGQPSKLPQILITAIPLYPYKPLISLDKLYEFANSQFYGSHNEYSFDNCQKVANGVCKFSSSSKDFYREVNAYGLVYINKVLGKIPSGWSSCNGEEDKSTYIDLVEIILNMSRTLKTVRTFYNHFQYFGSFEINVHVKNIANESLMFNRDGLDIDNNDFKAIDDVSFATRVCMVEEVGDQFFNIVTGLTKDVLWVFNCSIDPQGRVKKVLEANKMV